ALEACLGTAAKGSGMAAELALYEYALLAHRAGAFEAAVERLAEHQRRFPDGVLAPEASRAKMTDLLALGRVDEARHEAEAFVARYRGEPGTAQVESWMRQLELR